MKIAVFGATGTIGHQVVNQALAQDHQITALARNPEKLGLDHDQLTKRAVDVFDAHQGEEAIAGNDAVIIVLGSAKLTGQVRSVGTRNIIAAMKKLGVKRLICQTTLGIGDSKASLNFYWKYLMFGLILRSVYQDHIVQEGLVKNSGLDWTIVRPAAFTDGPVTEKFYHGFFERGKKLTLTISRADVAAFILQELSTSAYLRKSPGLSY